MEPNENKRSNQGREGDTYQLFVTQDYGPGVSEQRHWLGSAHRKADGWIEVVLAPFTVLQWQPGLEIDLIPTNQFTPREANRPVNGGPAPCVPRRFLPPRDCGA